MTKLAPAGYSEQYARARFDQALTNALNSPRKPLMMTATLKRRALKKKPARPVKTAGKAAALPAILSLLHDLNVGDERQLVGASAVTGASR
jgi:hypothetical protein